MKGIKVAIVTDDNAYGEALIRGLGYRSRTFLMTMHSIGRFIEEWKKGGIAFRSSYDLILWDGEDGERIRGGNILWLTDRIPETSPGDETGSGEDHILYRYDTASAIHSRIMGVLEENCAGSFAGMQEDRAKGNTRSIAFGSWQGGVGCTTICRAMGQELTRFFDKRVLWLSLDGIEPGIGHGDADATIKHAEGVDRFLYEILDGKGDELKHRDDRVFDIDRFTVRDGYGLETFRPSMGRNPMPGLGSDEIIRLMSVIAQCGFDAVLIDAGTCCSDGAAEIMGWADRICLVGKGNDDGRKDRYISWMRNSTDHIAKKRELAGALGDMIMIEDIPEPAGDPEILLEGEFGKNIHALTEALWYNEIERTA